MTSLCSSCVDNLPLIKKPCLTCATPMPDNSRSIKCGKCIIHPPIQTKTISAFEYKQPVDQLITKYKFHYDFTAGHILIKTFIKSIKQNNSNLPEAIIPVPLHRKKIKRRGFNQSIEIAKIIVKDLGIPILRSHVIRIKNTDPQSSLPSNKRTDNLKNAFELKKEIPYKHIAIIDDIYTTGSTITSVAKLLKKNGVENIEIWCLARATLR